jgi:hypothetical protein
MKPAFQLFALLVAATLISATASESAPLAPNTWVKHSEEKDCAKWLASVWHMAATDEFMMWGPGGANVLSKKYDVETFDLVSRAWSDALPKGKEQSWANGQFPSWVWHGQSAQNAGSRLVKNVGDHSVGGFGSASQVDFVETEGVQRPTRCPTFYQGCYDSKRNRMLFFLGGKTFSFDPKERTWSDLKPAKVPSGCEALVWASLCYDSLNDQALLFGGGMALNTWGGAKTWLYDCAKNEWIRPELKIEPPLRCNTRMVYDSRNKVMVLFGGDDQRKALNDTWVYDVVKHEWSERKPASAPLPSFQCAATYIEKHGLALFCTIDTKARAAVAWTYNAATNEWTPIKGSIPGVNAGESWISCDYSAKQDAVVLTTVGAIWWATGRTTWLYHFDPATAADKRAGAAPGTFDFKHPEQQKSIQSASAGERKATEDKLKNLPVNQWVDANPPGAATNKTWSDCTIDTDKGVILYYGGGHSAYSGSDVAHYDIGENRWSLSYDPEFPPFLESTNRTVFGWAANLHPWSEHTRRWYAYDSVSKMMVYCRQGCDFKGRTLYLGKDGKKAVSSTGADNWIYDPAKKKFYEPTFDRPFGTDDGTCLVTTPKGVYALASGKLWLCKIEKQGSGEDETYAGHWTHVSDKGPRTGSELNPTLYDSKRNRLVSIVSAQGGAEMWAFDLNGSAWSKIQYKGTCTPTREACYIPTQDVIFQVTYGMEGGVTSHQVFRCATNEWVQADIAFPKKGTGVCGWDTSLAYDPVHNVVVLINSMSFGAATTVFELRYDDKLLSPVTGLK